MTVIGMAVDVNFVQRERRVTWSAQTETLHTADARKLVNTKKTVDDTAIVHNASFV